MYSESLVIQLDILPFLLNLKHVSVYIKVIKIAVVCRITFTNESDKFENADQLQDFLPEQGFIFYTEAKIL